MALDRDENEIVHMECHKDYKDYSKSLDGVGFVIVIVSSARVSGPCEDLPESFNTIAFIILPWLTL